MNVSGLIRGIVLSAALMLPAVSFAEWKPSGPINLHIGFGAGGETDTLGRALAAAIEEKTGWDMVVENKPGGGGVAMFSGLQGAEANGQTLGMGVTVPIMMNLALRPEKLPFNLESFDYLGTVMVAQLGLVAKADAPFNTVEELIAYSKKEGGALISFDAGPQRMILTAVSKSSDAGFEPVSHQSSAEQVQSLLGGQVVASVLAGAQNQYIEAGKMKLIAPFTEVRHAYAKDVPTLKEQGYDYAVEPYFYLAAPKGASAETISALEAAINEALADPKVVDLITNSFKTVPSNLGGDGTKAKMSSGLDGIKSLIKASSD